MRWRCVQTILTWVPVGILISDKVGTLHRTSTSEMSPAVPANSVCVIWRSKRTFSLTHGLAVAVKNAEGSKTVVRRIVGLGGDYVRPRNNNKLVFVPPGFVWLEADCPQEETECEGETPIAAVIGRVSHILPSGHTIAIEPSERAFPSNNHQLYAGTR